MSELTDFRSAKDHFMLHDHHSPMTDEQRQRGQGLDYFGEQPDLRLELELEQYEARDVIEMQTSTGDVRPFVRWGKISFEVDGEPAQLTIYKDSEEGDFFLPFADGTSGDETYGAGRYLDMETLPDGRALVDFNYAYNPYCAYDDRWTCPITPAENRLKVNIHAGEKNFR